MEKKDDWKWARISDEAREVTKLQEDFIGTVHATKKIALIRKRENEE